MKFVHVIGSGGMYTKDLYEFISTSFPIDEHCFVTQNDKHDDFAGLRGGGCKVYSILSLAGVKVLNTCDYIIAHSLISSRVLSLFAVQPWLIKKLVWIIWGGDIYYRETEPEGLKKTLVTGFRKRLYERIPYVGTVSSRDYSYAEKHYGLKAKTFEVTYPVASTHRDLLDSVRAARQKSKNDVVRIQIGNSATASNCHIEALDMISHLKDENIRVFLPLCYGGANSAAYASRITEYARRIFGDKVEPMTEILPSDDYLRLLSTVDVGLFNNSRQQGMGNISQLILCGAKVYLRSDVSMWDHFASLGCKLSDISDVRNLSLSELTKQDRDVQANNIGVFEERHGVEKKREQWGALFSYLSTVLEARRGE